MGFRYYRHELPIHRANLAIVNIFGDSDVFITLVLLESGAEDMAKFGRAHGPKHNGGRLVAASNADRVAAAVKLIA